jgi:hypothetical protein
MVLSTVLRIHIVAGMAPLPNVPVLSPTENKNPIILGVFVLFPFTLLGYLGTINRLE